MGYFLPPPSCFAVSAPRENFRGIKVTIIELKIIKYQHGEGMAGLAAVLKCPVHLLLCRTGCSTYLKLKLSSAKQSFGNF
jgi:hypothetical protein